MVLKQLPPVKQRKPRAPVSSLNPIKSKPGTFAGAGRGNFRDMAEKLGQRRKLNLSSHQNATNKQRLIDTRKAAAERRLKDRMSKSAAERNASK